MLVTKAAPNIYLFYLLWAISGLGEGSIKTGINIYCLDIWRGHSGGGPWMNSIHFAFSLGTTIGPILATPFLSKNTISARITESRIDELYPISGAIVLASSAGFLVMALHSSIQKRYEYSIENALEDNPKNDTKDPQQKLTLKLFTFVVLICIFFFLYVGAEVVMGVDITTFTVKSSLHMSKAEGAFTNAMFWGAFATGRFLSIFLAIYLNPRNTLVLSFVLCIGIENHE